ncbi:hypothetical protein MNQ98_11070 [Paenibacillus sp. N3/727]|uniref:hypothetical protein n=1 Tax=Paenibacillus sp. N3/727 TaxID=2925845 RepID=UPI001F531930|nr:hypothetical protein [Paenibacillus sp. N3/727]UNK20513.1 hypothetical protein MNQ98_11070 [Paenibacillus sp. N3/727]
MRRFIPVLGLWIPALVTALFLLLLSVVHSVSGAEERRSVSAFKPEDVHTSLSDANLVDSLSSLPLALRIGKADWDNGTLSVDLKIMEELKSVRTVYNDLASIISFSFEDKQNVKQLYLRFVAIDPWTGARYLMLAANVRRNEWDLSLLQELKQMENEPFSERLVQGFHLTLTNVWAKQFITD